MRYQPNRPLFELSTLALAAILAVPAVGSAQDLEDHCHPTIVQPDDGTTIEDLAPTVVVGIDARSACDLSAIVRMSVTIENAVSESIVWSEEDEITGQIGSSLSEFEYEVPRGTLSPSQKYRVHATFRIERGQLIGVDYPNPVTTTATVETAGPEPDAGIRGTIEYRESDGSVGGVVTGAEVIVTQIDGSYAARDMSGPDGNYRVRVPGEERYTVTVKPHQDDLQSGQGEKTVFGSGWTEYDMMIGTTSEYQTVRQESREDYDRPLRTISGEVTVEGDTRALPDADLVFERTSPQDPSVRRSVDISSDGSYELRIPTGRYEVRADHSLYHADTTTMIVTETSNPTLNVFLEPDQEAAEAAAEVAEVAENPMPDPHLQKRPDVELDPGEGLDVEGIDQPDSGLRGTVVERGPAGAEGDPVPGAKLTFTRVSDSLTTTVESDQDGSYEVHLPTGGYQVRITHPDHETWRSGIEGPVVGGSKLRERDFFLEPEGTR